MGRFNKTKNGHFLGPEDEFIGSELSGSCQSNLIRAVDRYRRARGK